MEWYRDDLDEAKNRDPLPKLKEALLQNDFNKKEILKSSSEFLN